MIVSVIFSDGTVAVDGVGRHCVLKGPEGARAAHWDGEVGFVEYAPQTGRGLEFFDHGAAMIAYVDAWASGVPVEDEDPGEQPDLGQEMLAAEEEAAPAPTDHGGVLIHYDQVEIARAQLSMATSDHEEILVGALSNRWPDLIQAFTDTNNLAPDLWSEQQGADRQEFMRLSSIESRIRAHAVALRRSIKDADEAQLRNIGDALTEGWPS